MTFYSLPFLIFFCIFLLFFQLVSRKEQQWYVILAGNILFYGFWDWRFLILLGLLIVLCWASGSLYEKTGSRWVVILPAVCCLLCLAFFKYANFFISSFCAAFRIANPGTLQLILPLGISFYVFQLLSYLFDLKNGTILPEHNFVKFAAYISFFPQITSGPIVKAHDFLPQLDRLHRIRRANVYRGMQKILLGLTKKFIFADRLGVVVQAVFSAPGAYDGVSIFFAMVSYSMQIYFDFSGYSDMALGIGEILDFDLGKNFDLPYLAQGPSDFWKRWHISLSSWFRDYVYIPLGGSRRSSLWTDCNLMITMLLSGLWHGANWNFLIWGGLHGIWSILSRKWRRFRCPAIVSILFTDLTVTVLWVFFRADNLSLALGILSGLFRFTGVHYISSFTLVFLGLTATAHILAAWKQDGHWISPHLDLYRFSGKLLFCIWAMLIVLFMYVGKSAFIYANF